MTASRPRILISGASSGIGADLALRLARGGWQVFAGVRRAEDGARLAQQGEGVTPVLLDVTSAPAIAQVCGQIAAAAGLEGLQALVVNAGIAVAGPIEGVPMEAWRAQFETNVFGAVALTQSALPLLRRGRGRVVLMGSVSGVLAYPWLGAYAASKHALEAIADSLRLELSGEGLPVTLIEPAAVRTPIWSKSKGQTLAELRPGLDPAVQARYQRMQASVHAAVTKIEAQAMEPSAVSSAVAKVLSARRPPARIALGRGAGMVTLIRLLPARFRDRLILRSLQL